MEECIAEGVVVLIQRDKTYRPFILKKGRQVASTSVTIGTDRVFSLLLLLQETTFRKDQLLP